MPMIRSRWLLAVAALTASLSLGGPSEPVSASPPAPAGDNTRPCRLTPQVTACQSTDPTIKTYVPFQGNTSGCTFDVSVNWGDNSKTQQVFFTNPPDGNVFLASHTYAYSDVDMPFTITINAQVTAGGCTPGSLNYGFALLTCTNSELSGPSWAGRFPDRTSVAALSGSFRTDVSAFVSAMRHGGIKVRPISTLRPAERAFLMHYSWLVANRKLAPLKVPRFHADRHHPPVGICWVHVGAHGANVPASITAARKLATALGVASLRSAPLLASLRTQGLSITMSTTWSGRSITVLDAAGLRVRIHSTPHNGLNSTLIAVGATYGVIHFRSARQAMNVWSVNGH